MRIEDQRAAYASKRGMKMIMVNVTKSLLAKIEAPCGLQAVELKQWGLEQRWWTWGERDVWEKTRILYPTQQKGVNPHVLSQRHPPEHLPSSSLLPLWLVHRLVLAEDRGRHSCRFETECDCAEFEHGTSLEPDGPDFDPATMVDPQPDLGDDGNSLLPSPHCQQRLSVCPTAHSQSRIANTDPSLSLGPHTSRIKDYTSAHYPTAKTAYTMADQEGELGQNSKCALPIVVAAVIVNQILLAGPISKHLVSFQFTPAKQIQLIKAMLGDRSEQEVARVLEPGDASNLLSF